MVSHHYRASLELVGMYHGVYVGSHAWAVLTTLRREFLKKHLTLVCERQFHIVVGRILIGLTVHLVHRHVDGVGERG